MAAHSSADRERQHHRDESLGAEKYVHFRIEGAGAQSALLEQLAVESGQGENEFVARVSTESQVRQGGTIQLALDTSKLVIFDGDSGENLTIPDKRSAEPPRVAEPAKPAE